MIDPERQSAARIVAIIKTIVIAVPIITMVILVLTSSLFDNPSNPNVSYNNPAATASPRPQNTIFDARTIPQALLTYRQIRDLPTGMNRPMDIAWADNKLYVAGDDGVVVMYPDTGVVTRRITAPQHPTSIYADGSMITVTSTSALYSMQTDARQFKLIANFTHPTRNLVDACANMEEYFVADSASGTVCKVASNGEITATIHPSLGEAKFMVTATGDFDVIFGVQGMLWISDPGRGQVMAFNTSGMNSAALNWGRHGEKLANFSGTYNPVHIAVLPNTNIATAEINPPRIKVYTDGGTLVAVVAWEDTLSKRIRRLNLTTDADGHIYALDDTSKSVRVYEKLNSLATPLP